MGEIVIALCGGLFAIGLIEGIHHWLRRYNQKHYGFPKDV